MERAKCKASCEACGLFSQLLKRGKEIKTKPRSIVPILVVGTEPPEFWEREADPGETVTGGSIQSGSEKSIYMFLSVQQPWGRPKRNGAIFCLLCWTLEK